MAIGPENLANINLSWPNEPDYYELSGLAFDPSVFYTGAQTTVNIGGTYLLNAIDCSWNEVKEHKPYWGYRSTYYDAVFRGRCVIQGVLVLNLLDTRLLSLIMEEEYKAVVGGTSDGSGIIREEDLTAMVGSGSPGADLTNLRNAVRERTTPRDLALQVNDWLVSESRYGVEMYVHYGDLKEKGLPWAERKRSTAETLKGVVFTSDNRSIAVTSQLVVQGYSFFCRVVEPT